MFVYFTDVRAPARAADVRAAHAPVTARDASCRSATTRLARTTSSCARSSPESEWVLCEGAPGTVVFADTCGYHKQLKPESGERLLLVAHYVSGKP